MINKKEFSLSIESAGGPIQLNIMNNKAESGLRLLGGKGSPFKKVIKSWDLSKEDLKNLIKELKEVTRYK